MSEAKVGSVTVKALMLIEYTHPSPWSPQDTAERLHRSALQEMETAIQNDRVGVGRNMRIVEIKKIMTVTHSEDR